jgi:PAS domain S-box-containing protein
VADGLRTNLVILFPLHNAQGLAYGLGGIATDITARKDAEETLRRQKKYSEALVSNSPVAIVTLDMDAVIISWNPAAEQLFGYTPDEAVGHLIYDVVAKNETIRVDASGYADRVRQGEFIQAISQRTRKDGTLIDVEMLAVPVVVDNRQVGMIVIYHDITELQRARKEAEAASQAKSTFLATMSHEIRTPLNAIIGMSGLLLDTPLAAEQYEFTETIRTSSNALLSVINDILDFSKIEAGHLELDTQPFDLRDCLEETLDLVAPRAAEKHLDIAYLLDEAAPLAVVGDMPRLRQILINLLSNAVKFTMQGEVVVSVSASVLKPGRDSVPPLYELHFAVRDTGIGIPADRMDRLFKSFSQVDASTTRQFGGTGLGLVISKRLAELMNGSMWVESAGVPGQGAIFHFTIQAHAAPASPARARLHQQQPHLRGKRLIIVDDNATNRRILQLQARSWGMLAFETSLPQEALDWVRRGDPFDVGILDMQMPEMDGIMLAAAIRREPIAHELPLVMLTSLGQRDEENHEAREYFAAYLTKPIKASQLYNVLVDILEPDNKTTERAQVGSEGPSAFNTQMADDWPLRILLAEDNRINQRLVMLLLERLGYRIDIVADGVEALDAVRQHLYDVVLMDMQMPEMDGLETTRRIRAEVPATRQPHIIALTANALQGDREACLQAGMDDYLSKPIEVDALVLALRRVSPHIHPTEPAPEPDAAPAPAAEVNGTDDAEVTPHTHIDPAAIERLTDTLGTQAALLLPDLIDAFCKDALRLQAQARQTFEAGDSAGLRRAAHTLKSNSANFGVIRLTALCQELEDTARNGDLTSTASDLLDQVATAYEQACPALEALRQHVQ